MAIARRLQSMVEAGSGSGRNVVVVIGIDRYAAWDGLGNAVSDARGTAAAFRRFGFEEHPGLFDRAATRNAIHSLVDDLKSLRADDNLVVFFAGHGASVPQDLDGALVKTGYLIPADAENVDRRVASWVRLDHWLSDIARLPPRHILVILDACHSGIALDAVRHSTAHQSARTRDAAAPGEDARHRLTLRRSRQVIVSALDDEVALDGGPHPGHSLFTGCLLAALSHGLRSSGTEVSATELGVYLQKQLAEYPDAQQTPTFTRFELDDHGEMRFSPAAATSEPSPAPSPPDVNAALRARLASALAEWFSDREAIARVVHDVAPRLAAADFPAGSAAMIWGYVLAELSNSDALAEIGALIAAARKSSWRARRFDWSMFHALHTPRAARAAASWSHIEVAFRRDTEHASHPEAILIPRGKVLLEADVTLHWGGARPPAPRIEVTSNQLFGTKLRPLHRITQLPSLESSTARWRVRIQVPAARIRTRWVTVRCAGTDASARRYVVARRGALCAGALWLACAGFAALWLYPISAGLVLLPLVLAGLVLGVVPPIVMHLLWRATGQRSFRRLLFAWELAAPLALLATTLVVVLPPRLLKLVSNHADEMVPLGGGATLAPRANSRAAWAWHIVRPPAPLCVCGEPRCACDTPEPIHGVDQVAFGCFAGDCKHDTEPLGITGEPITLAHSRGVRGSPLRFGARATSWGMKLDADGFWAEARDVPPSRSMPADTVLALPMLPPRAPAFDLTFTGRKAVHGTLHCEPATPLVVRIDLLRPGQHDEPWRGTLAVTVGKVRSTWTGALDEIRGCADPADGDSTNARVELRGEQSIACRLGPELRTVALDGAALAPGRALPGELATFARACLGDGGGSLELTSSKDGIAAKLPADIAFTRLLLRWRGAARTAVEPRCAPGQALRTVTMAVPDVPRFELDGVRVDRVADRLGVTCDASRKLRDAKRICELTENELRCAPAPPPPRGPVDCRYDQQGYLHDRHDCASCRPGPLTDDLKNDTAHRGYACRSICQCE